MRRRLNFSDAVLLHLLFPPCPFFRWMVLSAANFVRKPFKFRTHSVPVNSQAFLGRARNLRIAFFALRTTD